MEQRETALVDPPPLTSEQVRSRTQAALWRENPDPTALFLPEPAPKPKPKPAAGRKASAIDCDRTIRVTDILDFAGATSCADFDLKAGDGLRDLKKRIRAFGGRINCMKLGKLKVKNASGVEVDVKAKDLVDGAEVRCTYVATASMELLRRPRRAFAWVPEDDDDIMMW